MKIACLGGGPAAVYFSILYKKAKPDAEIVIYEREKRDVTWGFGVVFSDATMDNVAAADPETYQEITDRFFHWDDIDVHYGGEVITSSGHGFAGFSRIGLLDILRTRAEGLGVDIRYEADMTVDNLPDFEDHDLVLIADGIASPFRDQYKEEFETTMEWRSNKFVWFGTTKQFDAFTFYFRENEHGLFRVHAYSFEDGLSTFIVECRTDTWEKAGLDDMTEDQSTAYVADLFKAELDGHELIQNKSLWRTFPVVRNGRWHYRNMVLMGDALHTAHFSVGSGTKLAMEDGIALCQALVDNDHHVHKALHAFEDAWRPAVESLQRAAQVSLNWFEEAERYYGHLEAVQFTYSLLTRSLRVEHSNLKLRDPDFIHKVDTWFATQAAESTAFPFNRNEPPPPMFTPFELRGMRLENRVMVSPMCQYSAEDGVVNDWHLTHLGSRAIGGAGLVMTEMTAVSAEGRITPGCAGMYKPEHVTAWKRIVDFVHSNSWAKIALQIGHSGRKGSTKYAWDGLDQPLDYDNWQVMGPSEVAYGPGNQTPREMTREDMAAVCADFANATRLAEQAGFDMLEIHLAHGYLLSTFITPLANTREDEYGGSMENRMRFALEVFDTVRAEWPEDKPISVRISAHDWKEGGITPEDAVEMGKMLKEHGCDIVDVSSGQVVGDEDPKYGRLFQTPFAERVRMEAGIPTMAVGNISSYTDVNSVIAAGRADICALARAHLFDPYWVRHAAEAQGWELQWPVQYGSVQVYKGRTD